MRRATSMVALLAAVALWGPSGALAAQTGKGPKIRRHTKQARAFKPFAKEMGGRKLKDSDQIELPNGRRMTAKKYFSRINSWEQRFAKIGHTLRDKRKRIRLATAVVDTARLKKQKTRVARAHVAVQPGRSARRADLRNARRRRALDTSTRLDAVKKATPTAKTQTFSKSWSDDFGQPDLFGAYLSTGVTITGKTSTNVTTEAHAKAGVYVFGKKQDALSIDSNVRSGTETLRARVTGKVVGKTIFNLDKEIDTSWSKSSDYEISKKILEHEVRASIGPFPVKITVGARGQLEAGYWVGAAALSAGGKLEGSLEIEGYAEVAIDVLIGGGGVGGRLTLLDYSVDSVADGAIELSSKNKPVLVIDAYAKHSLTALAGELYAFAYIYVPKGFFKFEKKQWEYSIVDFDGIKTSGYLFNVDKNLSL